VSYLRAAFAALLVASLPAQAEWLDGITNDGALLYAVAPNQDGNVLGQWCTASTDSTCRWGVVLDIACADSGSTPALISGAKGGVSVNMVCDGSFESGKGKVYRFAFGPFDTVDELFRGGGTVGIAFPLASGRFQVIRFDMTGVGYAVDKMRERAKVQMKASTRGQTL
jgi:hypothetical protein